MADLKDHPDFHLAIAHHQAQRIQEALEIYLKLLRQYPDAYQLLSNCATAYFQLGRLEEGIASIERSLQIEKKQPDALNSLGNALSALGQFDRALESYAAAIDQHPLLVEAYMNRGVLQARLGWPQKALIDLDMALELRPEGSEIWLNKGMVHADLGDDERSISCYQRAIEINPTFYEAHFNLGLGLHALRRLEEAYTQLQEATRLGFHRFDGWMALGLVLYDMGLINEALEANEQALALNPNSPILHINLGNVLFDQGRFIEALTHFDYSIQLQDHHFEAYTNRGRVLLALHRYDEAMTSHEVALQLNPNADKAYINRAFALVETNRFEEAGADYLKAYQLNPKNSDVLSSWLYCTQRTWQWELGREVLKSVLSELSHQRGVGSPFPLLAGIDDPAIHLQSAKRLVLDQGWTDQKKQPLAEKEPHSKISLGYFSSDFRHHPVGYNLRPLLQQHDRSTFRLVAFDYSPAKDSLLEDDILNQFDVVHFVSEMTDEAVATLAQKEALQIAIDLNGHTKHARTGIFSHRVAPVQINYLGYPGSMGAAWYDYVIADEQVIPLSMGASFTEKVAHLPHFFMPYSFDAVKKEITCSGRLIHDLPEDSFIFCSFNDAYKITENIFLAWMKILRATNAYLLFANRRDCDFSQIQDRAQQYGVDRDRLIPAPRLDSKEDHFDRLSQCHLMLDTSPYNSHTTACDAIYAGLPILTLKGQSFASRVTASLLSQIGLPQLITHDVEHYEERATQLASDPNLYREVRHQLMVGRENLPSSAQYARNIETLFKEMLAG